MVRVTIKWPFHEIPFQIVVNRWPFSSCAEEAVVCVPFCWVWNGHKKEEPCVVKQIKVGILCSVLWHSWLFANKCLILDLPVLLSLLRSPLSKQLGTCQEVQMQAVRERRLTPRARTSKSILIESESVAFVSDALSISPQINLHPAAPLLAPCFLVGGPGPAAGIASVFDDWGMRLIFFS